MRINILAAGVAAAVLIPSFALAQQSCEQQRANRTVGTVAGAGAGALAGSAIAGGRDRTTGAILGGLVGGVIGNQVTKGDADCAHAYGYYEPTGTWHASNVSRDQARGYYDRQGTWVAGAPNGYYDNQGRWTANSNGASGYYDSQGRWMPTAAPAEYRRAPAYDNGRANDQREFQSRLDQVEQRIRRARDNGALSRGESDRALRTLSSIRRDEERLPQRDGQWNRGDARRIEARLDALNSDIRADRSDRRDRSN